MVMQGVEVIEMTREEWDRQAQVELDQLGLTYEELAEQARTREFSCEGARRLWLVIGGSR
jgi:hypothetical protein